MNDQHWRSETVHSLKMLSIEDSVNLLWKSIHDTDSITVSERLYLRDSLTFKRFKTPCKGVSCHHLPCFELDVYQQYNKKRGLNEYRCPICDESCCASKLYVDSVLLYLLELFPDDFVSLSPDGRFAVPSKISGCNSDVITLDEDDDDTAVVESVSSSSGAISVSRCSNLVDLCTFVPRRRPFATVRWSELCRVDLDDVMHYLNSSASDESLLQGVHGITKKCGRMLIANRPMVSSTFQGLNHALQMTDGIGHHKAEKLISCAIAVLEAKFSALRRLPQHEFLIEQIEPPAAAVPAACRTVIDLDARSLDSVMSSSKAVAGVVDLTGGDDEEVVSPLPRAAAAAAAAAAELTTTAEPHGSTISEPSCSPCVGSFGGAEHRHSPHAGAKRKCSDIDGATTTSEVSYCVPPRPLQPARMSTKSYRSVAASSGTASLISLVVDHFLSEF